MKYSIVAVPAQNRHEIVIENEDLAILALQAAYELSQRNLTIMTGEIRQVWAAYWTAVTGTDAFDIEFREAAVAHLSEVQARSAIAHTYLTERFPLALFRGAAKWLGLVTL